MADRISFRDLEALLADDTVADDQIAPYLRQAAGGGRAFVPELAVDPELVEVPATRGLVGLTVKSLNERAHRQRRAAWRQRIDGGWNGLRLLAEGDSWFLYPVLLRDVVDQLSADYAILSEAAAGDTLDTIASGRDQLASLVREHRLHGLLLSAGGNDIAGEALERHIAPPRGNAADPSAWISRAYADFLAEAGRRLEAIARATLAAQPELRIFCHGYDWPFPAASGRWLSPAMRAHAVPAELQGPILRAMIDRYNDMLARLARRVGERLVVVDCRGSIGEPGEWFDELHPANPGFGRVADRFRVAINSAFGITARRGTRRVAEVHWGTDFEHANGRAICAAFPVGTTIIAGSAASCQIVLRDGASAAQHARMVIGAEHAQLEDLDTGSGSFVDGASVRTARWRPGQRLRIGTRTLLLAYRNEVETDEVPLPAVPEHEVMRAVDPAAEASDGAAPSPAAPPQLEIEIIEGDISEVVASAYVLGVFQQVNPLSSRGACSAIDLASGGAISEMAQSGLFNAQLGEVTVLPLARSRGVMELVLFAGLGALSTFAARSLEIVGEHVARMLLTAGLEQFATVPIGANAGVTAKDFAVHFLTGLLKGLGHGGDSQGLRRVLLCELDSARFGELGRELAELSRSGFFSEKGIDVALRETPRPAPAGAAATETRAAPQVPLAPIYLQVGSPLDGAFEYYVLSAALGAAIQSHRVELDRATLEASGAIAAKAARFDAETGGRLAGTFLPATLQEQLAVSLATSAAHLVVIHDRASSAIPWETFYIAGRCPALEMGVSRLYRLGRRERVTGRPTLPRGAHMRMLVVENPTEDLPGAGREGAALSELFAASRGAVTVLRGKEATRARILSELSTGSYDLLHYAGHADFAEHRPEASGLLCSDGTFTAADLRDVGRVPQMIFLNACESGRLRKAPAPPSAPPGSPASLLGVNVGLAEGFLVSGVANFIGTYWPVSDLAALEFSKALYGALLAGDTIGVALRTARQKIVALGPRDWANYLHFGDPLYRVRQA